MTSVPATICIWFRGCRFNSRRPTGWLAARLSLRCNQTGERGRETIGLPLYRSDFHDFSLLPSVLQRRSRSNMAREKSQHSTRRRILSDVRRSFPPFARTRLSCGITASHEPSKTEIGSPIATMTSTVDGNKERVRQRGKDVADTA